MPMSKEYYRRKAREWSAANPEKVKAKGRAWRKANPERQRAACQKWATANPDRIRALRKKWNLANPDKVRAGKRRKAGLPNPTRNCPPTCELCGGPPNGRGSLCLDHCHASGKFRGWLCSRCNTGLGIFRDSTELLYRAAAYLDWMTAE